MATAKGLHKRNPHNSDYNFTELIKSSPELDNFVSLNKYDNLSINFSDSEAVLALNKAILIHFYGITDWSIPRGHLCPPIPGRADYIHYIADLLGEQVPNVKISGIDIGVGTGCIYPIIGASIYDWSFVATDINSKSIQYTNKIIENNNIIKKKVTTRIQTDPVKIFKNIISPEEHFNFSMCNPPFHTSLKEAKTVSARKVRNLNRNKLKKGHKDSKIEGIQNFGGEKAELWCPGGELKFITDMIKESALFEKNIDWFTTLVSKTEHLDQLKKELQAHSPRTTKVIKMQHGQKQSHILAWSFIK